MTGSGTQASPYVIETVDDLLLIGSNLSSYFELGNDITMEWQSGEGWVPIAGKFTGTLDGKGHKIIDLMINRPSTTNVGFFAYLNGTVKNIEFTNARIVGNNNVSIIAGEHDSGTATFSNVKVQGILNLNGSYCGGLLADANSYAVQIEDCEASVEIYPGANCNYCGGLLAYTTNTATSNYIKRSSVSGVIGWEDQHYNFSYCGGLAGVFHGGISNCKFDGKIYGGTYLGGILGRTTGTSGNPAGDICDNTASGLISGAGSYLGGIIGSSEGNHRIYRNLSRMDISSITNVSYVGGIIGQDTAGTAVYYLNNNEFYGKIELPGGSHIGGILGYASAIMSVYGNINYGDILCPDCSYVGGICGYCLAEIYYCVNFGTVSGRSYTGGILGRNYTSTYIHVYHCMNMGDVICDRNSSYNGGIVGSGFYCYIYYCINAQKVGRETVYAIRQNEGASSVSSCYLINWSDVANWKSKDDGMEISEADAFKQSSYVNLNFSSAYSIIEGEELPRPQNCGIYPAYTFNFIFPNSLADTVTKGEAFDATFEVDWDVSKTTRYQAYFYDGKKLRRMNTKIEHSSAKFIVPMDVEESYGGKIQFVFWTSSKMYFICSSNNFRIVDGESLGLVFTDENYSPYNMPDGTILKNIRFSGLFLNSLSAAKKVFVYNNTDATIQKTTITVDNSVTTAVTVLLGSVDTASFEAEQSLVLYDIAPHEFRPIYLKVQTTDDPSAALVPVKLYAEQTVVA